MAHILKVIGLLAAVILGVCATHDDKYYNYYNQTTNHTNDTGWQPRDGDPVAMPIPQVPIMPKDHDDHEFNVTEEEDDSPAIPKLPYPVYKESGVIQWFPRIVGGMPSALGQFPSKVSIQLTQFSAHTCGASLIDPRHVLTAAHCVVNDRAAVLPLNSIRLMAGDILIGIQNITSSRQFRFPTHIFVHTSYNHFTLENDIAVVRFDPPLGPGLPNIAQIGLNPVTPSAETPCTIAGWGATNENSTSASPHLIHASVSVISTVICNSTTSYNGMIRPGMLCAGVMAGGVDSCQGDSGGGLICNNVLAGVVSFGYGCARPNFPGVYADVSHYVPWINQMMAWAGTAVPTPTTVRPSSSSAVVASIITTITCFIFSSLNVQV